MRPSTPPDRKGAAHGRAPATEGDEHMASDRSRDRKGAAEASEPFAASEIAAGDCRREAASAGVNDEIPRNTEIADEQLHLFEWLLFGMPLLLLGVDQ